MHCTSFLIIKNSLSFAFSQEAPSQKVASPEELKVKNNFEKLKKATQKLEKRYQGKKGASQLKKDTEDKVHTEIENIRDYNEVVGNKNVLQVLKGYDRAVVRESINGKEVVRFKTLDELKKEAEITKKILLKTRAGNINSNSELKKNTIISGKVSQVETEQEKVSQSKEPVAFNYQMAIREEQRLRSKEAFKQAQKEYNQAQAQKIEVPVTILVVSSIVFIAAGFLLWKKLFK